jgi:hypothetical protein
MSNGSWNGRRRGLGLNLNLDLGVDLEARSVSVMYNAHLYCGARSQASRDWTKADCERVRDALDHKILYAVLTYAYLRPNEPKALKCRDAELDTGLIDLTRAWDFEKNIERANPKTAAGVRFVPIEMELLPLLRDLCAGLGADDYLFPRPATARRLGRDLPRPPTPRWCRPGEAL